jgi:histidine triad (HIT) family protein
MESCIFCKIIRGEIPCEKVYEDDKVLAFLDISPMSKGHTLIMPKKHSETVLDTDEQTLCDTMKIVKRLSKAIMKAVKADGINIAINNYKSAGQLVPHLHVHVMPRFSGDKIELFMPKEKPRLSDDETKKIAEAIKKAL